MLAEIIGWLGAAFILVDYYLLTSKKVVSDSKIYHLLNIMGGFGIGINAFYHHTFPSVLTNIVWVVIAIIGYYHSKKS